MGVFWIYILLAHKECEDLGVDRLFFCKSFNMLLFKYRNDWKLAAINISWVLKIYEYFGIRAHTKSKTNIEPEMPNEQ